jgi:SAM-dependent methyltransferase
MTADTMIRSLSYTDLDFNSPLSDARATELLNSLRPLTGVRALDLGCGWAELLLRLLETDPSATGTGVDADSAAIARGRANAVTRGLTDRVRLEHTDVSDWTGEPADVVTVIGSGHAWGGPRQTLEAVAPLLRPGGRLLLGEGFWERPPTEEALAALDATPDDYPSLEGLVALAVECGYRPLAVSVANADEWDSFESRWCGGLERWALEHPGTPEADRARQRADQHRAGWMAYRGILGLAYLTLARP